MAEGMISGIVRANKIETKHLRYKPQTIQSD